MEPVRFGMADWLGTSLSIFLTFLLGGFLPLMVVGAFCGVFTKWAIRRLIAIGGMKMLYITGWLGVPLHELAHAIAALIGRHTITKFQPLAFDSKSGTLGVVETKYDQNRWYPKYVGNFLIPIAPLASGSFILIWLLHFLIPKFSVAAYGAFTLPTPATLDNPVRWLAFIEHLRMQAVHLVSNLWQPSLMYRWEAWLIGYAMVCVALHMPPSGTDWKNFFRALIPFGVLLMLISLAIAPFPSFARNLFSYWGDLLVLIWPLWLFWAIVTAIATLPIILISSVASSPGSSKQPAAASSKRTSKKRAS